MVAEGDFDMIEQPKETLVAPVPRIQIMIGRTLGGATTALIQGTLVLSVCLIAGFRPENIGGVLLGFVFMALIAMVFAVLGTIIGSALRDMQGFQLIMNFLVMPIFFLSGALYPLSGLPPALQVATHLDPLSYGVDGLRDAFIGESHFGVAIDLAVLGVLAALFLALGARAFSRIQV
jgi:ABC-2 type transport system permease protein